MSTVTYGSGVAEDPWKLTTPPGASEFLAWRDESSEPTRLVVLVGKTELAYQLRCVEDLHQMLSAHADWMPLGNADEGKDAKPGTIEAWARSSDNPVGGYYGLRKGYRGRFANYVTPVMELLGLVELEHGARNNSARAIRRD